MAPAADLLGLGATQHLDDVIDAKLFAATHHTREKFLRLDGQIDFGLRFAQTVVAVAAPFFAIAFAKVGQQPAPPAPGRFHPAYKGPQPQGPFAHFGLSALLDQVLQCIKVAIAVEQQAIGPEPVATGLAGTLDRATERLENGGRDAELAAELEALAARLENGAAGVANKRQAGLGQALAAIAQRLR